LWAVVVHFRRKMVIARVRCLAFAIGSERLIKRGPRASKIVEDLERDSRSGTAHVDHQKDVIGLVFNQRLGRRAAQKKSTPPRPGRAGPDGGFRRNELQVGQRRDN
jgi:hypothetical protein